jgi:hypothetical protein
MFFIKQNNNIITKAIKKFFITRKNYSLFFFFEIVSINVAKIVTIKIIKVIVAIGYCGKAFKKLIFRIFFLSILRNVIVFYH